MPDCDQNEAWSSVRACAVPAQSCTSADRGNAPDRVGSKQSDARGTKAANKPRHSWACAEHQPRVGVPGKDASYDNALECVLGYMARQPSPRELSRGSPGPPLPATFPFPGTQYAIRRATHRYPNRLYIFSVALVLVPVVCVCRRAPSTILSLLPQAANDVSARCWQADTSVGAQVQKNRSPRSAPSQASCSTYELPFVKIKCELPRLCGSHESPSSHAETRYRTSFLKWSSKINP